MATLIAEDGSRKTDANSYATVAAADTYHEKHLYATTWTAASTANKEKALMMATRLLDAEFSWAGIKATEEQALEWPRYDMTERNGFLVDGDEIPAALVDAVAEFARHLLSADRTAETDDRGYSRIAVGPIALDVNPIDRKPIIPSVVVGMLAPYGRRRAGGGNVQLVRA